MRAARATQLYCEKHPEAIYPFIDEVVDKTIRPLPAEERSETASQPIKKIHSIL